MIRHLLPSLAVTCIVASPMAHSQESAPTFTGKFERLDPSFDQLIAPGTAIEVLSTGFNWSEGPVWRKSQSDLLFSDVPENTVFRWKAGESQASAFLHPSGGDNAEGAQGSNGLAIDAAGQLVLCQHGARRVARMTGADAFAVLADRFEGKRLNSPNDLVLHSNGTIYFTDPPYGLKGGKKRELDFSGVYRISPAGGLSLLIKDLTFPNGIALSPDEKILYVAVSDPADTRIMAYDLQPDGTATSGRVFFNANSLKAPERKGLCDGMKVDQQGNVWSTGPGGVLVISKEGHHLGSILTGQATGNCAFGEDGSSLFITADMFLLRVRARVKGTGF